MTQTPRSHDRILLCRTWPIKKAQVFHDPLFELFLAILLQKQNTKQIFFKLNVKWETDIPNQLKINLDFISRSSFLRNLHQILKQNKLLVRNL